MACAPPTRYTASTPAMWAAARMAAGTLPSARGGGVECGAIRRLEALGSRGQVLTRHLEGFGFLRRPTVEPPAVIAQRRIPLRGHPRADLGHVRSLLRELGEIKPPPRKRRVEPGSDVKSLNRHQPHPLELAPPSPGPCPSAF